MADNKPKLPPGFTLISSPSQEPAAPQTFDPSQEGMQPAADRPGFLKTAWSAVVNPAVDSLAGAPGATAKGLLGIATGDPNTYDNIRSSYSAGPSLKDSKSPALYGLKQGLGGAVADTADQAAGISSPASIGTLGLGAEAQGGARAARHILRGTSAAFAGKGAADATDILTDPNKKLGNPDVAQQLLGSGALMAGGTGGIVPAEGVGNFLQDRSYGTMNNLLGTYGRDMKYGINPGRGVVQEGIAGANKNSILNKIDARIPQLSDELNTTANSPLMAGRTVDLTRSVNEPFDIALAKGDQQPSSYLNRLLQTKKELTQERTINGNNKVEFTGQPIDLKNMDVAGALGFKQGIGRRTLFENDSEGANVNPTLKEVYGRSNADIRGVAPEIAPTLDRLADLTTAGGSLNSAIGRKLANPSSGIKDVAPAVVGSAIAGAPGAGAMILGRELFNSTPVKSYGAQLMFKAGQNLKSAKPGTPTYGALAAAMAANRR